MTPLRYEFVKGLFRYDPQTGDLIWRFRPESDFATKRAWSIWNARFPDNVAGYLDTKGYIIINIKGQNYGAHRIIWLFVHGVWPAGEIDHVNGYRSDNRIANLRHVTSIDNGRNQGLSKNNTSGVIGVSWSTVFNLWVVGIGVDNKWVNLGRYSNKEEAITVRKEAELKYGFHPNHGTRAAV